jgi:hypothetical protein
MLVNLSSIIRDYVSQNPERIDYLIAVIAEALGIDEDRIIADLAAMPKINPTTAYQKVAPPKVKRQKAAFTC